MVHLDYKFELVVIRKNVIFSFFFMKNLFILLKLRVLPLLYIFAIFFTGASSASCLSPDHLSLERCRIQFNSPGAELCALESTPIQIRCHLAMRRRSSLY